MKIWTIIATLFLAIFMFLSISLIITNVKMDTQLKQANAQLTTLHDDNTKLTNENIKLYATSNLKSFENVKALQRFVQNSKTIKNVDPYGYASVSCIALMKEAKESGYWLGLTVINNTDESVYSAMKRDRVDVNNDIKWHTFNIAIVGDCDIYLVDSQDANNCFFIVSVNGDFADYNKDSESNISNLNLH